MFKARHVIAILFGAVGVALGFSAHARGPGTTSRNDFDTEEAAMRHCSGRPVVWVILTNKVYYLKGDPEYGGRQQGAYMCEDEAMGDRNRLAPTKPQPLR